MREFFGQDPDEESELDLENPAAMKPPSCHCIGARVTAENPSEGFTPTSGLIEELHYRSIQNVNAYFSVGTTGGIHAFADSQFGHIFARGPSREQALKTCVLALKDLDIRGEICNNVNALEKLLQSADIRNDVHHTAWLDKVIASKVFPFYSIALHD